MVRHRRPGCKGTPSSSPEHWEFLPRALPGLTLPFCFNPRPNAKPGASLVPHRIRLLAPDRSTAGQRLPSSSSPHGSGLLLISSCPRMTRYTASDESLNRAPSSVEIPTARSHRDASTAHESSSKVIPVSSSRPSLGSFSFPSSFYADSPSPSMSTETITQRAGESVVQGESSKDGRDHDEISQNKSLAISSTTRAAGQTVAPFLAKHVPSQYAPMGGPSSTRTKDPNTKYCYRHHPDSKCRRTADEPTMENLQRVGLSYTQDPPMLVISSCTRSLGRC